MSEDISVQILTQASENIQKLFDLSIRIDERVKLIQTRQEQIDKRIDDVLENHVEMMKKIAVLESKGGDSVVHVGKIKEIEVQITSIDKRLATIESDQGRHTDRWNRIGSFLVQLVWVVLAAYVLTKLKLQPPSIP